VDERRGKSGMTKFEYKFGLDIGVHENDDSDYTEEDLNQLGREGWELVSVVQCGKGNAYLGFFFKRPR
jgi:hypothetical protein